MPGYRALWVEGGDLSMSFQSHRFIRQWLSTTVISWAVLCSSFAHLPRAHAQPTPSTDLEIDRAMAAFDAGDFEAAKRAAQAVIAAGHPETSEAWRILGLSLFYLEHRAEAEHALLEYLKHDPEAHLDPALHPPQAVVFFESIRTRHAATLDRYRSKKETRRLIVAVLPPFAQLQNKHSVKAILIGSVGLVLAGTHLGAGIYLRSRCAADGTCELSGQAFRRLKLATNVSGLLGIGLLSYGVIDGVYHFLKWKRQQRGFINDLSVGVRSVDGGGMTMIYGSF